MPTNVRRPAFWLAVAAVGYLGNIAVEILADRIPSPGLRALVSYSHKGKAD